MCRTIKMKYITTQPDEFKFIIPATYKLHFMISQIMPVRGKHLDLNLNFNQDSAITLTNFFL